MYYQVIDGLGTALAPATSKAQANEYIKADRSGWILFIRDIRK